MDASLIEQWAREVTNGPAYIERRKVFAMDEAALAAFASRVAAHEREACAKVCEHMPSTVDTPYDCAAEIRARK